MKKIVVIAMKSSYFHNSWVWKYISNYIPYLSKKYNIELLYQPEETWFISWWIRRIFKLPNILKEKYDWYIKIFTEENFLISVRKYFVGDSIMIVHHYPFKTKVTNFKEEIIRRLSFFTFNTILKKLKSIIAVSDTTKSVLVNIWINAKYITVIPNSIDITSYKQLNKNQKEGKRSLLTKKFNIPNNLIWLLFVWSNESRKNLITLLKTLHCLSDEYILLRVWKDGSKEELVKMGRIINDNNLLNRYYHLQDLSEEDLISLYQISDIYLMPSLYEWFWRPIIEAQSCWLPVISTKCWALEEVCWDWALFVNDPMNEKEYVKLIKDIINKKELLIQKWLSNANKYSTELNAKKLERLIDNFS